MLYGTYFGGGDQDNAVGMYVGNTGKVYLTGITQSSDFPVLNPYDGSYNGGQDAFLAIFGSGACSYTVGDANGNGSFNGLDVVYSVTYFKGGPPPPYSCDCPPHGTWYVAGDVNASCNFNGLDVSYMVSYLKGGPAPQPCADCPPAR